MGSQRAYCYVAVEKLLRSNAPSLGACTVLRSSKVLRFWDFGPGLNPAGGPAEGRRDMAKVLSAEEVVHLRQSYQIVLAIEDQVFSQAEKDMARHVISLCDTADELRQQLAAALEENTVLKRRVENLFQVGLNGVGDALDQAAALLGKEAGDDD